MADLEDFRSLPLMRRVFTSVVLDVSEVPAKQREAVLEFFAVNRKFTTFRMLVLGLLALSMPLQVSSLGEHFPAGDVFAHLSDVGLPVLRVVGWVGFCVGLIGLYLALRAWESHRAASWLLQLHRATTHVIR